MTGSTVKRPVCGACGKPIEQGQDLRKGLS